MKKFAILCLSLGTFLSYSANAQVKNQCGEFALKAVSCYEKGYLANQYDETGEGCGSDQDGTDEGVIWLTSASENPTVESKTISQRSYEYPGGRGVDTECYVEFENSLKQACGFDMLLSLGSEDGSIEISNFNCR